MEILTLLLSIEFDYLPERLYIAVSKKQKKLKIMGYTLMIGERITVKDEFGEYETVRKEKITESPGGAVPTAHTNSRWPSYAGWSDFCRDTRLSGLFSELIANHPGIVDLEKRHLDTVRSVDKSRISHYNAERLEWLEWWMDWALNNCKNPAFYNS